MLLCVESGTVATHLIGNARCVKLGMLTNDANNVGVSTTAVRVVKKSIGQTTRKPVTLGIGARDVEERVGLSHAVQTARRHTALLHAEQRTRAVISIYARGGGASQAEMIRRLRGQRTIEKTVRGSERGVQSCI